MLSDLITELLAITSIITRTLITRCPTNIDLRIIRELNNRDYILFYKKTF